MHSDISDYRFVLLHIRAFHCPDKFRPNFYIRDTDFTTDKVIGKIPQMHKQRQNIILGFYGAAELEFRQDKDISGKRQISKKTNGITGKLRILHP